MIKGVNLQIKGKQVTEPVDWMGVSFVSTFNGQSALAEVEGKVFTLVGSAYNEVIKHYNAGDIFKGLPVTMQFFEDDSKLTALDGYFDLTDEFSYEEDRCYCKFKTLQGKLNILEQINGMTYYSLYKDGFLKSSDFGDGEFVLEKPFEIDKFIMSIILIYILEEQIEKVIKDLANTIGDITAMILNYPTGSLAAFVMAILRAIAQVAYAVALIVVLTKAIIEILNYFFPPTFFSKGVTWRALMEAPFRKLGYTFKSDIQELSYVYYPSAPSQESTNFFKNLKPQMPVNKDGVPKSNDFGYFAKDWMDFMVKMFDGAFYFNGTTVTFYSKKFQIEKASKPFVFNDIYIRSLKPNTSDIQASKFVTYSYDATNHWSINSFAGSAYEKRQYIELASKEVNLLKGLDEFRAYVCIAPRKNDKNFLQEISTIVVKTANKLASVIGKKLPKNITDNTIGSIVISEPFYSMPMIAPNFGKLKADHKDKISPKYFIEKYWNVDDQYVIAENVTIPMRFKEFIATTKNNLCVINNISGKFENLVYNFADCKATATIYLKRNYTKKIKTRSYE